MISVFVPAYNEESILYKNIKRLHDFLKKRYDKFEIIIVNDNSTDNTEKIATKLCVNFPHVKLLNYSVGPSRRENLAKSFCFARGDIIVFIDADLSPELEGLDRLIKAIEDGFDIAVGSKYIKGSKIKRSFHRLLLSKIYNSFMEILFRVNISDHTVGLKAWKKDVILQLVKDLGYDYEYKRGLFWDTEMFIHARRHNYKIKEIPIEWKESKKTSIRFWREFKILPYALKLRWKL